MRVQDKTLCTARFQVEPAHQPAVYSVVRLQQAGDLELGQRNPHIRDLTVCLLPGAGNFRKRISKSHGAANLVQRAKIERLATQTGLAGAARMSLARDGPRLGRGRDGETE